MNEDRDPNDGDLLAAEYALGTLDSVLKILNLHALLLHGSSGYRLSPTAFHRKCHQNNLGK